MLLLVYTVAVLLSKSVIEDDWIAILAHVFAENLKEEEETGSDSESDNNIIYESMEVEIALRD